MIVSIGNIQVHVLVDRGSSEAIEFRWPRSQATPLIAERADTVPYIDPVIAPARVIQVPVWIHSEAEGVVSGRVCDRSAPLEHERTVRTKLLDPVVSDF